jgi:hypothetical protein
MTLLCRATAERQNRSSYWFSAYKAFGIEECIKKNTTLPQKNDIEAFSAQA